MAVDDLWYSKTAKDENGKPAKLKRHGRGKRWRVRYTDPNTGKPAPSVLFDRKTGSGGADEFDANIRADISRGLYIDPNAGTIQLRDFAEDWRKQQRHRDGTAERVERGFRLHLYPMLGTMEIGKIRGSHVRSWMKDRSEVLADSTLGILFVDVKAMFTDAINDRVIGWHPFTGITPPASEVQERFIPSPEQVLALAKALPERYRPIPFLAAGTGLRPSELRGLELRHVNFLKREVHVEQQLLYSTTSKLHIAKVKTPTSKRTIELPQIVIGELARHLERFPATTLELRDLRNPRKPVTREARLLFTTDHGGALYGGSWSGTWKRAVQRANKALPEAVFPERYGLHMLRHYFATLLIHAGKSVKTVQLALGHSKPSITLDTYTHEWPDARDRTRDIVDATFTGLLKEQREVI